MKHARNVDKCISFATEELAIQKLGNHVRAFKHGLIRMAYDISVFLIRNDDSVRNSLSPLSVIVRNLRHRTR